MNELTAPPPPFDQLDPLEQIRLLREELAKKDATIAGMQHAFNQVGAAVRQALGEKAKWETEGIRIADKWRTRNQQLAGELQLAQVGLTSGCGCPIGECQQRGADQGSCWMLWAEAHVLKRLANVRIGDLQNASRHPTRFAKVRAEGGPTAKRLANPEPTDQS